MDVDLWNFQELLFDGFVENFFFGFLQEISSTWNIF